MKTFREYLIEAEIKDFYTELNQIESFYYKESMGIINKYPLVLPIHEAIIYPENIKINSSLDDGDSLNKEFKKLNVIFHLENYSRNNDLNAHYRQTDDEIHVYYSLKNSKLEIEAMIGHEMIHREQHKKSNGNYFERAKKLTAELNALANKFNKTQDINVYKEYNAKKKFKDFDDHYEQMAYVYQIVKENPTLTPNQLVKYFQTFGFEINYRLKKYIGMYYIIKDKL